MSLRLARKGGLPTAVGLHWRRCVLNSSSINCSESFHYSMPICKLIIPGSILTTHNSVKEVVPCGQGVLEAFCSKRQAVGDICPCVNSRFLQM